MASAILDGMRVALLGLGLIGGSVARALRAATMDDPTTAWSIAAWTPGGAGPRTAAAEGVIDLAAATPEAAIDGADLVVLAGPVPVCIDQLDELAGAWRSALTPGAVITDVASTKGALVLRATALGLRFVGGHPMAGRETSGYAASSADLFVDRPWVVVPATDEDATERVEVLARACGARPVRMAATAHDDAVAAISHLPLVVAAALVEAVAVDRPDWPAVAPLAASGWRDTTRLARGDATMGAGIVATNAPAIASRLRDLIAVLEGWLTELERPGGPDAIVVADRLQAARARLEALSG
jgi:prephenate dehydrogenase